MYTDGSKDDKRTAMSFVCDLYLFIICDDHEFSCRINLLTMRLQSAQQNY